MGGPASGAVGSAQSAALGSGAAAAAKRTTSNMGDGASGSGAGGDGLCGLAVGGPSAPFSIAARRAMATPDAFGGVADALRLVRVVGRGGAVVPAPTSASLLPSGQPTAAAAANSSGSAQGAASSAGASQLPPQPSTLSVPAALSPIAFVMPAARAEADVHAWFSSIAQFIRDAQDGAPVAY